MYWFNVVLMVIGIGIMGLGMYSFFAMRHQAQPRKNESNTLKEKQFAAARGRTSLQECQPKYLATALTVKDPNSPALLPVDQDK